MSKCGGIATPAAFRWRMRKTFFHKKRRREPE
jgi:hypothetical protein